MPLNCQKSVFLLMGMSGLLVSGAAFSAPTQTAITTQPTELSGALKVASTEAQPAAPASGLTALEEKASTQLPEVKVTGWATPAYNQPHTSTATGTQTLVINVPQSIQVIPEDVLRDQASQSLADAIRNAPGVSTNLGEGNRDEFYIRGVKTKSDFFTNGLRDDSEYFRDLYNVAHLDVLLGPAAILFGRGGAGGIINLVTKKAERRRIRHVSLEAGSFGHQRGTFDVGDAIGQSGAFRLMGMSENSGGFRDHDFLRRHAINPEFRFRLGDRTELGFGFSYLKDYRFADRGIPSQDGRPADVPRGQFFGSVDQNRAQSRTEAFNVRISHRFNDHLELRNAFRVSDNKRLYQNVYPAGAVDDQGQVKLKGYWHPNNRLSYLDRLELIADFSTGALEHTLLTGTEFGWQRDNDKQMLPRDGSKSLPGTWPVSDPTVPPVSYTWPGRDNRVVGKEFGVFAEDQMSFGEHWRALLGMRWDRFSVDAHYRQPGVNPDHTYAVDTAWSPRAGLIYKPVDNASIYASVTQTFTPQGANISLSRKSPEGANLAPEKATNREVGGKFDLFDGDLSITAALFQLDLDDVVSKSADGSGDLVSTGAQRNRGVQFSIDGALTSSWDIYANYTHLNAEITQATKDAAVGARVGLVPRDQFSIWTRYALTSHWGIAAGVRGASDKYTSYDNDVVLPRYTVADAMAWYQTNRYRVQLNFDNLTDKHYYPTAGGDNQIMPGAPRNVNLSVSMDF